MKKSRTAEAVRTALAGTAGAEEGASPPSTGAPGPGDGERPRPALSPRSGCDFPPAPSGGRPYAIEAEAEDPDTALEVAGMAESQGAETGAATDSFEYENLTALEERLGPVQATELKQPGRAAGPADRVARACQLARSHAPTVATD